ncbi:DUF1569 domain-containing protein [Microbacterium sp. P07]|uniref:DUF1569 domain-containing protein n=1 Tax=Microbacterium sp. P07 TaxID=3366952 RepID=UPI0037450AC4
MDSLDTTPAGESSRSDLRIVLDDLARAIAADPRGSSLTSGGTFTLTETLQHAAQSIEYSLSGYPVLKPVGFRTTIGRAAKHLFLRRGAMKHNLAAPVDGAPELDPHLAVTAALRRLEIAATALLAHTGSLQPHPTYGVCTPEQGARLQAMHLREHLPGLEVAGAEPVTTDR